MDLTTSINCRFLSMDEDKVAAIHEKLPYVTPAVIPAGSYKGQDEEIVSCTTVNFLISSASVDDEIVYAVCKALDMCTTMNLPRSITLALSSRLSLRSRIRSLSCIRRGAVLQELGLMCG